MFEKEIKFISDFCLNKVKGLGSFFTYEKLAGTDLHPAILRYISAELDYMIYSDRKKQIIFDPKTKVGELCIPQKHTVEGKDILSFNIGIGR